MYKFILCCLFVLGMNAQQIKVSGTVKDSSGNPIENVNIFVSSKKSQNTISDKNGNYSIFVAKESSLTFKLLGFKSQTIQVLGKQNIQLVLQEDVKQLGGVSISGYLHQNQRVVVSNRLGVKAVDMPTSTTRIDASLMQEQMILKPSEVFMNVAGVYQFNQGYGGTGETVGARGLSLRYQGYMFRNGLRMGANQSGATPEIQIFEAVEVHKGASAINFGYTSVGAVINYVTKKPTFKNESTITMRAAQYSFYKPSVDVNFKVNEKLAFRAIATYENAGSFRETLQSQRALGFLTGVFKINEKSSFTFNTDYLWDKTPRDFGVPVFENQIVTGGSGKNLIYKQPLSESKEGKRQRLWENLDRTRFLGSPFNDRTTNQLNAQATYELKLWDKKGIFEDWKGTARVGYSNSSNAYLQTGSGFRNKYKLILVPKDENDIEITRTLEKGKTEDTFTSAIGNITGKIILNENITNKVSLSMDYDGRSITNYRFNNIANFDKIKLSSSDGQKTEAPEHTYAYKQITNTNGIGASWQNLISFYDKFNVLLSARYDVLKAVTPSYTYEQDYGKNKKGKVVKEKSYGSGAFWTNGGGAWSFSSGVVYKINPTAQVYGSYLSGFELNRRFRMDKNGDMLPGFNQYQWEIGAKQSYLDEKINVNLAYYNISTKSYFDVNGNRQVYEITNGTIYKGWELETSFRPISAVVLNFNYTNIAARYKNGFFKDGTRPQQTPEHQAGFSGSYTFLKGTLKNLKLNFSGQYTGERNGNDYFKKATQSRYSPPYLQKAQTLLAAGVSYSLKNWNFNVRGSNLTDLVVFNSYRYGSVNPIAPRTITTSVSYNF